MEPKLNQEEYSQYDRQIHIWGAENQKKIINSNIAFVFCDSLCSEVAKNIVLAGMNVTIYDDELVIEGEYRNNYFLRKEDVGLLRRECVQKRLQELNPRASLKNASIKDIDFNCISVILFCNPNSKQLEWISTLNPSVPLYCMWSSDSWGLFMNAKKHQPIAAFFNKSIQVDKESILPRLMDCLHSNTTFTSPIAIEAVIGGIISQTLVSVVTGQSELEDSIEFDASTLNVTEYKYEFCVCRKQNYLKKSLRKPIILSLSDIPSFGSRFYK